MTIPGLQDRNERLEEQIAALEERMTNKEQTLIRQFAEMEQALAQAQSAGQAVVGLASGGGGAG